MPLADRAQPASHLGDDAGGTKGIYLDVDTSAAGFKSTPVYVTSIGDSSSHYRRWRHVVAEVLGMVDDGVISGGRAAEVLGVDLMTLRELDAARDRPEAA